MSQFFVDVKEMLSVISFIARTLSDFGGIFLKMNTFALLFFLRIIFYSNIILCFLTKKLMFKSFLLSYFKPIRYMTFKNSQTIRGLYLIITISILNNDYYDITSSNIFIKLTYHSWFAWFAGRNPNNLNRMFY